MKQHAELGLCWRVSCALLVTTGGDEVCHLLPSDTGQETNKFFFSPGCRFSVWRTRITPAFASQVLLELDTQKALSPGLGYKAAANTNQGRGPIRQRDKLRPLA